jgi:hypothetical protein
MKYLLKALFIVGLVVAGFYAVKTIQENRATREAESAQRLAEISRVYREQDAQNRAAELVAYRAMSEEDLRSQANLCRAALYNAAEGADVFNFIFPTNFFEIVDQEIPNMISLIELGQTYPYRIGIEITVVEYRSGFTGVDPWLAGYRCRLRPDGTVSAERTGHAVKY